MYVSVWLGSCRLVNTRVSCLPSRDQTIELRSERDTGVSGDRRGLDACALFARLGGRAFGWRGFVFEGGEEFVESAAGDVEGSAWEFLAPSLFELGDDLSGGVEDLAAFAGREDQLCSAVGRIGTPFEIAEMLELVDEFRAGGQAQLRLAGEVGQPDAVDAEVAPHLEVGETDVEEPAV